jgi:hypothetical protein
VKENAAPQLVPLRIPSGWCVQFNSFFDVAPITEDGAFTNASYFSEDLLSIERIVYEDSKWPRWILDLGWYPAEEIGGRYRLVLAAEEFRNKLKTYETREVADVVNTLERWLIVLSLCTDEKDVDSLLAD